MTYGNLQINTKQNQISQVQLDGHYELNDLSSIVEDKSNDLQNVTEKESLDETTYVSENKKTSVKIQIPSQSEISSNESNFD